MKREHTSPKRLDGLTAQPEDFYHPGLRIALNTTPDPRQTTEAPAPRVSVCVLVLMHGHPNYYLAGRETVLSVLQHSDFDALVAAGPAPDLALPPSPRVRVIGIGEPPPGQSRALRFLKKFEALSLSLRHTSTDYIVLLDADAVLVEKVTGDDVRAALDGHDLGMVEQTTIRGSGVGRADFLRHYTEYSLPFIAPGELPPSVDRFRFFNSGVVLGTWAGIKRIADWALNAIGNVSGEQQVREHMIADQDYFQYWVNNLHLGCCVSLPWYWNHCEHWDTPFPRRGARVVHFSNFCNGPDARTVERMRAARKQRLTAFTRLSRVRQIVRQCFSGKRPGL